MATPPLGSHPCDFECFERFPWATKSLDRQYAVGSEQGAEPEPVSTPGFPAYHPRNLQQNS